MAVIQTVTGTIEADQLGPTLMHEHLTIGMPGWEAHTNKHATQADRVRASAERIGEMQALGYTSMIDPCPADLGRDIELMAEVADATGFNLIAATGLYNEGHGGVAYWRMRSRFGDCAEAMAEMFVHELTEGVGRTGIKAGIIKVATGPGIMTDYENAVFRAAAIAAVATGAPITTHTDEGTVGDLQQALLTEHGVAAERVVIGHSCGTSDHAYHWGIATGGSYLGFDRFGLEGLHPDKERVKSLVGLIERGAGDRVVVSHDSVFCWSGEPFPDPATVARIAQTNNVTHFATEIVPQLRDAGVTDEAIDALTTANPRRFFSGEPLPALS